MYNPKVLLLSLNYLGIVTASLGMLFFKSSNHSAISAIWRSAG